jgi:hypothetical protein
MARMTPAALVRTQLMARARVAAGIRRRMRWLSPG